VSPRLPYGRQSIDSLDVEALAEAARGDFITQGPTVAEFERALAEACGAPYAVAVSSGTAALHLAALAAGVGPGDAMVVPTMTFVASANAAVYCGATPLLIDIDPATRNLSVDKLAAALDGAPAKAVVAVHYAGLPAPMAEVARLARARGAAVIEDACHALGAQYLDGDRWHRVGECAHSDMTCFSFHPVKHITTGEGGAVTTSSEALYRRLLRLRSHGITKDPAECRASEGPWYYEMVELGWNYRITDLQCALGRSQLAKLPRFVERRREIAARYDRAFADLSTVVTPPEPPGFRSSYHLYPLWLDEQRLGRSRRAVFEALQERGIGVQVHYIPVHLHPFYKDRFGTRPGQFPEAERFYRGEISIPMYPALNDSEVSHVIDEIRTAVERKAVA